MLGLLPAAIACGDHAGPRPACSCAACALAAIRSAPPASARYAWQSRTATDPSPTAEAAPLAGVPVRDRHPDQLVLPQQFGDTGLDQYLDVGKRLDAIDEVARHVFAQIIAPRQEVDLVRALGQEQRRLPGRVSAADD